MVVHELDHEGNALLDPLQNLGVLLCYPDMPPWLLGGRAGKGAGGKEGLE